MSDYIRLLKEDIPVNDTNKVVVSVSEHKSRGSLKLDIRHFFQPEASSEWIPTKKGINVDQSFLPILIEKLRKLEEQIIREKEEGDGEDN